MSAHPVTRRPPQYGLMAEYTTPEAVLAASTRAHESGYRRMDAFAPYPVEGLAEALGHTHRRLPFAVLAGGIFGGTGAYFMMWYASVVSYPLDVAGRPYHSWPSFVPITFELTVLFASFGALAAMLIMNRLPKPYHPVFNVEAFLRASQDRFFLCIECGDPLFDPDATRRFLEETDAVAVHHVQS